MITNFHLICKIVKYFSKENKLSCVSSVMNDWNEKRMLSKLWYFFISETMSNVTAAAISGHDVLTGKMFHFLISSAKIPVEKW